MRSGDYFILGFFLLFLFSGTMIVIENDFFSGRVTSQSTTSSVTISEFFSISMSSSLSGGIDFGTQNSTSANDINASGNYNASDESEYYIMISQDSNANVNLSIYADGNLTTSGADLIGLGNESYAYNLTNSLNDPSLSEAVSLTTVEINTASNVTPGSTVYYRFWLDIPAGTPVGTYNNTVNFKGIAG